MDGRCVVCLALEPPNAKRPHFRCEKCGVAEYCGRECRDAHRATHARRCATARRERGWVAGAVAPLPPRGPDPRAACAYAPPGGWEAPETIATTKAKVSAAHDATGGTLKVVGALVRPDASCEDDDARRARVDNLMRARRPREKAAAARERKPPPPTGFEPPGGWGQATLVDAPRRGARAKAAAGA
jgi:hypothetical protein